ncbi:hypothetical protein [Halovivax sp.]|uniref:hypothetical protein n=1 Tax=Halovivax sp. TaxID=1935978 RepID=UPI0025C1CC80|nr:hypothetical protein [Halovivax sp.]
MSAAGTTGSAELGRPDRSAGSALAAATLVVAFGLVAGPIGVFAGIATVAIWYAVGVPYALAVGHVALVALVPGGIDPLSFALVEVGFVTILLASVADPDRRPIATVAIASAVALGGTAWLVLAFQPLWLAAAAQLGVLATVAYALHRYELVSLGLVTDDRESPGTDDTLSDT